MGHETLGVLQDHFPLLGVGKSHKARLASGEPLPTPGVLDFRSTPSSQRRSSAPDGCESVAQNRPSVNVWGSSQAFMSFYVVRLTSPKQSM